MCKRSKKLFLFIFLILMISISSVFPTSASIWGIVEDYIGSLANFWCGWIQIHYGNGVAGDLKEGDSAGSNIIYIDRTEGKSDDVVATGYGLYQMDLKKHMVGYLYYVSSKASKDTVTGQGGVEPVVKTQTEWFIEGHTNEPEALKLKEACKYVADKLITTAYSKDAVDGNLNHLLDNIALILSADEVKKLQSDFWYKVYGQNAYSKLTGTLGFSMPSGSNGQKVQGAILSIMEDRYRNKTLSDKTKMQLKVEAGDLWPFLVYTETSDNGAHTSWEYVVEDSRGNETRHITDWEKMLEGAYQYMVYYEYKIDEEADSTDSKTLYNGAKAEIFKQEYEELFGRGFPELTGEALDDFYQKVRKVRRYYKKSKENGGGIFGEEELYDISSDVTYSQAIDKLKAKIQGNDVFKALDPENVARTYMMAKNIADNTRMIEQNAQYDIGSNIISRTPGGYDNQVLLSDLQLITLERDPNTGKYTADADGDGISDGSELGSEDGTYKPVNITGFVKQVLKAEGGEANLDNLLAMYIENIENARKETEENHPDVDRKNDAQHDLYVVGDKIYVRLMSYKSNPILKDTDFDGVWDGYGKDDTANMNQYKDTKPLDSSIEGQMFSSNYVGTINAKTHMDYRYFYMDKYNYYDELSAMSLLLSNAMYERGSGISSIDGIMEKIGLDNYVVKNPTGDVGEDLLGFSDVHYSVEYATAVKEIEYSKDNSTEDSSYIKKTVIPIVIKTPDSVLLSKSYSEIGRPKWVEKCDSGEESHNVKSYEVYAEFIKDNLWRYLNDETDVDQNSKNIVYWITGHKEAGAIANILASKYIDEGHEVYCYTFGSPMTLYNNPDEDTYSRTGYRARYDCIFNVVNEDDGYCFLMPQPLGFSRYGLSCYASGRKVIRNGTFINPYIGTSESSHKIVDSFVNLYKNKTKTREETYEKKPYGSISKFIEDLILEAFNYRINARINKNELVNSYKKYPELQNIINSFTENIDKVVDSGGTDVYYYLAKNMQNADIVNTVNFYDNKHKDIEYNGYMSVSEALNDIGEWYSKNVYTYDVYDLNPNIDGTKVTWNKFFNTKLKQAHEDIKNARKEKIENFNFGKSENEKYFDEKKTGPNDHKDEIEFYIDSYGTHGLYKCEKFTGVYENNRVGDDCSAFVMAVLDYATYGRLYNLLEDDIYNAGSGNIYNNKKYVDILKQCGFQIIKIDNNINKDKLESGDLLAGNGHYEFVIVNENVGEKDYKQYGWGNVYKYYPKNNFNISYDLKTENNTNHHYSYIIRLPKENQNVEDGE